MTRIALTDKVDVSFAKASAPRGVVLGATSGTL
jgi:hypothetical protein